MASRNAVVAPMTNVRFYHERVIDHYENPRNVGSLDKSASNVGTGLVRFCHRGRIDGVRKLTTFRFCFFSFCKVGAPACGDVMKVQIKVSPEGVIEESVFKTFGCGSAIASSSLATEWIKGKTVDEALAIKNTDIASYLSLPPIKLHCSMLAEDAIKSAIADYRRKQQEQQKA